MLKLYNTLTRKKEAFKSLKKGKVGFYSCGPTVYWYQHIGNLRSYIFSDVLKRVLEYNKYSVKHVMNITDVGHLTSDEDVGEDKIEKAAKKEGKKAKEIADYYLQVFRADLKRLNISEPNIWSKATEHIKEQIDLIKKLEKKGFTYKIEDGIYFDTSKLKDYGKLAKLNIEGLRAGKRVKIGGKKHKTDFALWKFSTEPGVRQQEWKSPWGIGFPGWHIECSAMAMKYLGDSFDIHSGGEDHVPVHHTNEIAQSEAATGKKFVNYWLHGAFLTTGGEKISKSKGGLYTISDLANMNYKPLAFRYFVLTTHYRKHLDFTLDNLNNAQNSYERLKNVCSELKDDKKTNKTYLGKFEKAIGDDLNLPEVLSILWGLLRDSKAVGKLRTVKKMDKVLGLNLLKKEKLSIPKDIKDLVNKRDKARKAKDWTESDNLRDRLKREGWAVDDTPKGAKVRKL